MTQPSPPTALVALSDVKTHLHIRQNLTTYDAQLQGFIDAATAFIQSFTGPIISQQFTETHDGGGSIIALFHPPVLTVDSIVEYVGPTAFPLTQVKLSDGPAIGTYSFTLESARGGILARRWNGGQLGAFVGGEKNIVVTYTGGRSSVPADVRMAVLQDIAGMWQPSQNGSNPYGGGGADEGVAPLNPLSMFPRVAAILTAPSQRLPGIA